MGYPLRHCLRTTRPQHENDGNGNGKHSIHVNIVMKINSRTARVSQIVHAGPQPYRMEARDQNKLALIFRKSLSKPWISMERFSPSGFMTE
jgi:hypothetical protein